ncbi:Small nuclear ribonucleoprotein F, putative [Giardia lamblia P15]|uniref:Small nuclear ribonucleoprotein F, putative n=1 Tax=Giardia intestinalis (strain P15) TaxID=658858 RepID=E1F7Q5_GIAIA|nr:Small nuclear ribonucleoprotein F, putative [Giardia lamblia P15]
MATNVSSSHPLPFPSVDSKLSALESVITPGRFLMENIGKEVVVRLKDGREYTGTLISHDSYYNLRLKDCTEKSREGKYASSSLKDIFIRCTSVHLVYTTSPKTSNM